MAQTVLFANPTAQSGKAEQWIAVARAALDSHGLAHEFIPTKPDGGTIGEVRRAIDEDGARTVVYMGGDGTFAEVAKGILGASNPDEVALGMLPTGTANDQGKSFGLSAGESSIGDNVAVIAAGHTVTMDVGRVRLLSDAGDIVASDLFFDSMSIGLGADVLAERNRDRERVGRIPWVRSFYRDQMVYAGAMVKKMAASIVGRRTFDLEVDIDGATHYYKNLLDVILKNTMVFGGEWVLAPDSRSDDGLFEMVPIAGHRDYTSKMLATLRHSPIGEKDLEKLGIRHSEAVPGSSFVLRVLQPGATEAVPAQIDGEEFAAGDTYQVDVLPRILRLIIPAAAATA